MTARGFFFLVLLFLITGTAYGAGESMVLVSFKVGQDYLSGYPLPKATIEVAWPHKNSKLRQIPVQVHRLPYEVEFRVGEGPIRHIEWRMIEVRSLQKDVPYLWCWGPYINTGDFAFVHGANGRSYLGWADYVWGAAFADITVGCGRKTALEDAFARANKGYESPAPAVRVDIPHTVGWGPFSGPYTTLFREFHFKSIERTADHGWRVSLTGIDPKKLFTFVYAEGKWKLVK